MVALSLYIVVRPGSRLRRRDRDVASGVGLREAGHAAGDRDDETTGRRRAASGRLAGPGDQLRLGLFDAVGQRVSQKSGSLDGLASPRRLAAIVRPG